VDDTVIGTGWFALVYAVLKLRIHKMLGVLGAFAYLSKATVILVMSVRPCVSVRMEHLGCHWKEFQEI
jgi:hypothetical protein